VRGIAEQLPFCDNAFDCVVCQGSLDHFARPRTFMAELSRILKPDGRAVIALANFESLSCRLGRSLYRAKKLLGIPVMEGRAYWQIPPNHTFKGDYAILRGIAEPWLRLAVPRRSTLWLFGAGAPSSRCRRMSPGPLRTLTASPIDCRG
jgi:SAM-dependent methyltransferase